MFARSTRPFAYLTSALVLVFFLGCSSAAYQPKTRADWGGYSERKFTDGSMQATFEGTNLKDEQRYSDFALLHAAEVTAKLGAKYFTVLDRNAKKVEKNVMMGASPRTEKVTETRSNGTTYERTASVPSARPAGRIYETWLLCTVRFAPLPPEGPPEGSDLGNSSVFEAEATIKRLKEKYRL